MELNLHPIATKSFVSGREFAEHDRVVSYLVRPPADSAGSARSPQECSGQSSSGEERSAFARYDLFEGEDRPEFAAGNFAVAADQIASKAFVYCRWVTEFKPRKDGNSELTLKLTAENLFLTIAIPAGTLSSTETAADGLSAVNTPLLQFLALMMERKKIIKLRGYTEDGQRQLYEHMSSHQMYEVPVGDLNVEFFQKIQEHLGVLVGTPKAKVAAVAPVAGAPAEPVAAAPTES